MAGVISPALSTALRPADDVIAQLRAAAVEEAGSESAVGEFLGAAAEDEVASTLGFAANLPGYSGWLWSVTGALVGDGHWTISEVVLLPGAQALVAPDWVPWDRRVKPGDLGAGELLPISPDDERLVPGYVQSDDPAIEEVAREFGLGRQRVLSMDGRADAADRWHDGDFGPNNEVAQQAPGRCGTCGFFTPLAGKLGGAFGACANDMSPADGRVVDVEYGCGSHSEEAGVLVQHHHVPDAVIDELLMEVHARPAAGPGAAEDGNPDAAGDVNGGDGPAAVDPREIALEAIRQLVPGMAGLPELPAPPVALALETAATTPIALGGPAVLTDPIALGPVSGEPVGGDDEARSATDVVSSDAGEPAVVKDSAAAVEDSAAAVEDTAAAVEDTAAAAEDSAAAAEDTAAAAEDSTTDDGAGPGDITV